MTIRPSSSVPDVPNRKAAPVSGRPFRVVGVGALWAAAFLAVPAFGEFDESYQFDANSLTVSSLIGKMEIGPATGSQFEVEVSVRGRDGTRENIRLDEDTRGSRARLAVEFPVEEERRYVYPEFSRRRANLWSRRPGSSESLLGEILRSMSGRRIRIERSGSGLEAWADVTIRVPEGRSLKVELGAGDIDVSDVAADLEIKTRAGMAEAASLDGDVKIGVGSGGLAVRDARGRLVMDTGSGGASLDRFEGSALSIDTGSGPVAVTEVAAGAIDIDTGSGGVTVDGLEAERFSIDTGSGSVRVESAGADSAVIDTGSGRVHLALERMGDGRFEIDTGSGGIVMLVPEDLSARFDIDIGSGGIDVDVPIAKTLHKSRGEMRFIAGDGDARVILDTGSGSVRVASVD
ncbi:MAG: DUF4097 family beta strand repeat-containing protein [Acidobacteria bacterium]|nr:DUF4097 family beta strand repeat-containing protein [Acidobacteriota bacterium]